MEKRRKNDEEDYGDYVTRCICDFKHDDGYMICCDECSVWQHIECMQVDPKNLPENYLCEKCEPRPVDKRRARQIQIKKRENLSDPDDRRGRGTSPRLERRKSNSSLPPVPLNKKRKKKGKLPESKPDVPKRIKKDSPSSVPPQQVSSIKKAKRRPSVKSQPRSRLNSSGGSIQSLLNAASLLDGGSGQEENKSSKDLARKFSGLWNANYSPWSDEYESVKENSTTEHVQKLLAVHLSQLKSEAVVYSLQEYGEGKSGDCDRPHPQCSVTEVIRRRKGVVADVRIPEDELVIEYKGRVTVKSELVSEMPGSKSLNLWQTSPCPFVYHYDKMTDLDICIDSRLTGNTARFIRRSCCPNAEVRHFFVDDDLHFGVYALSDLSPQEEVTLPFDYQHEKCDYPVECACGQVKTACMVAMAAAQSPTVRVRGVAKPVESEDQSVVSGRGRPRTHSHVLAHDEDSNSSWTSTASHSRKRKGHLPKATPLSPKLSRPTSREESSDSESEAGKRRKSLTREERKTEQVWKMFEKMEAMQRKRQQHVSEGSLDSTDPLTSPLLTRHHSHTSPLHTRHTPHTSTSSAGKERRTSSGSRKAQLLQTGKMRLSSVSSGDPLSPCDLFEPFSPPITPGLAPPATHTPPLLTPSALKPTVDVTPYLHPKYLLEEFVLPWKKAFLRKWESERLENGEAPAHYSYWSRSDHTSHAYHMTSEAMRPRIRGCLKHRWLSQHLRDEEEICDKENQCQPPLPHKKQVLLRWQGSEVTDVVAMEIDEKTEHYVRGDEPGVDSGRSSPLFDEFSDGEEFELPGRRRRTSDRSKVKDMPSVNTVDLTPTHSSQGPLTPSPASPSHTPPSPVTEQSIVHVTKASEITTDVPHPLSDHMTSHDQESLCSDISDDSVKELSPTGPKTPPNLHETTPTSPVTPHTLESTPIQSPNNAHQVNISDISSDMDAQLTSEPCDTDSHTLSPHTDNRDVRNDSPLTSEQVSPPISLSVGTSQDGPYESITPDNSFNKGFIEALENRDTAGFDMGNLGGGKMDVEDRPMEASIARGVVSFGAPLSPSAKTPIKRKINLSEYRNRARKPVERKPSTEKPSTPPLLTPLHPSTTHYPVLTTPNMIPAPTIVSPHAVAITTTGGVSGGIVPQFEPVSPDESDHTPPLGNMEGQPLQIQPMMAQSMMTRDHSDNPIAQGLPIMDHPFSLVMIPGYGGSLIQQQPQGIQQVMWSTTGGDNTHDPRRGLLLPSDRPPMYHLPPSSQPLITHPMPPRYVVPQGGVVPQGAVVPQNIMVMQQGEYQPRGFPHPHHHAPSPGGRQYQPPRHPGHYYQ